MKMTSPSKDDVTRMARTLRERWGDDVYGEIETRLNELRQGDDHCELVFWYLIREAIDDLIAQERPPHSTLH